MNIDKDIEILKDFINNKVEKDKLELNFKGGHKIGVIYKTTELNPALENVLKELETYKKIAEKLAEIYEENCTITCLDEFCNFEKEQCLNKEKQCKQCIIEWARKEVENDEL